MTKFAPLIAAALVALTASPAAFAATSAVLRVDQGSVMTSQGGEFATARSGQSLLVNQRLMVTEDSAATLVYDNGCIRTYSAPGVYVVEATCELVATAAGATAAVGAGGTVAGTTGTALGSAAAIAAGVAVTAALLKNMEEIPAPPISR